ncbi:hypothetical protein OG306_33335 [Streptomyces sp. NBC_01241]|uniref:hypothetical protein n=1 Tax=Streptomyces sp. NBC_01241 TaxID=2903794 RepID=UPI00352E8AAA|nr:hypothetical protein OG306_33335 [Streptomyces sp. NBC_01241]
MFKVGDRVEITSVDSLDGELGEVVEVHKEGFLSDIRVHLDGDKEMGYSPLWFGPSEFRKVEQA